MVSGSILAGLFGLIGTIFVGFLTAGLWVWRHKTNLNPEDPERITELEDEQISTFEADLAELYLDIEDYVEEQDPPDDMPKSELVMNVIRRDVDREDIEKVVDELEKIGDRRELYESHEQAYVDCYSCLFRAAASNFCLGLVLALAVILQSNPFTGAALVGYTIFIGLMVDSGNRAHNYFNEANSKKEEFERKWRDYKSPE